MSANGVRAEAYRLPREQVMTRIGRLLPQPMWGSYTLAIEQVLTRGRVA